MSQAQSSDSSTSQAQSSDSSMSQAQSSDSSFTTQLQSSPSLSISSCFPQPPHSSLNQLLEATPSYYPSDSSLTCSLNSSVQTSSLESSLVGSCSSDMSLTPRARGSSFDSSLGGQDHILEPPRQENMSQLQAPFFIVHSARFTQDIEATQQTLL